MKLARTRPSMLGLLVVPIVAACSVFAAGEKKPAPADAIVASTTRAEASDAPSAERTLARAARRPAAPRNVLR